MCFLRVIFPKKLKVGVTDGAFRVKDGMTHAAILPVGDRWYRLFERFSGIMVIEYVQI